MKEIIKSITDTILPNGTTITVNGIPIRFLHRWKNYFLQDYELENFDFYKKNIAKDKPVIIDLGAHLGLFSLLMAKHLNGNCKIYAFEAAPKTFKYMSDHIAINKFEKTIVGVNKAASDNDKGISFFISKNLGDNANSISSYKNTQRKFEEVKVASESIDSFAEKQGLAKLDFIKIDVEGAECRVVNGAKNSITKYKPIILLSIHPNAIKELNDDLEKVFDFLKGCGYTISYNNKKIEHYSEISKIEELYDLHLTT